eukprot:365361-Chlamydomonas_euryale.AAC.8
MAFYTCHAARTLYTGGREHSKPGGLAQALAGGALICCASCRAFPGAARQQLPVKHCQMAALVVLRPPLARAALPVVGACARQPRLTSWLDAQTSLSPLNWQPAGLSEPSESQGPCNQLVWSVRA